MLETLAKIGPFLSGVGLIITASAAAFTAFRINARQTEDTWVERFRALYNEFWHDPTMAEVRMWIVNDNAYRDLDDLLKRRNATVRCAVSQEEHERLDKIDRFCAVIARMRTLDQNRIPLDKRAMLVKFVDGKFWIDWIKSREELRVYVNNNWQEILR